MRLQWLADAVLAGERGNDMTPDQAAAKLLFDEMRASQKTDPQEVAIGLFFIAQKLDRLANRLRANAAQVRQGHFLADAGYAYGRSVTQKVQEIVDGELPEGMDKP